MNNNLSGQQFDLYHGSTHPFGIGDIIKPTKDGVAWSTKHPNVAAMYAEMGNVRSMDPYHKGPKSDPVLFGTVYKVEPLDDITEDDVVGGVFKSTKGLRVTGIHSFTGQKSF